MPVSTVSLNAVTLGDSDNKMSISVEQKLDFDSNNSEITVVDKISAAFLEFASLLGIDMYNSIESFVKMFVLKMETLEDTIGEEGVEDFAVLRDGIRTLMEENFHCGSHKRPKVTIPEDISKFQEQIANSPEFARKVMSIFLNDLQS